MACDWQLDERDLHYDVDAAMQIINHPSCEEVVQTKKTFDIYDCMDLFVETETLGRDDAW